MDSINLRSTPTVAYVPALLPSYEASQHRVVERSREILERRVAEAGARLITHATPVESVRDAQRTSEELGKVDLVIVQSATFAMGDVVLPFAEAGHAICLWAPSEPRRHGPIPLNGFVAMHLHTGVLRRANLADAPFVTWLFGDAGEPLFEGRLAAVLNAVRTVHQLRSARIVRIGEVAPTFLNIVANHARLRALAGVEVEVAPLGPFIREVRHLRDTDPEGRVTAAEHAIRAAAPVEGVSVADVRTSAALYLAMRDTAQRHGAHALALRDWPELQHELGVHPGMAMSWLDEAHAIPVAAEGDVGGAVSMLAARAASREAAMLLDVNDIDDEHDALLAWHCGGSPLAIADETGSRWTNHTTLTQPNGDPMGAVADLRFAKGPVTLLRIDDDGRRWFVVEADVVDHPEPGFDGSRGWLSRFQHRDGLMRARDVAETLLAEGIEHHVALVPTHVAAALRTAAALLGVPTVRRHIYHDDPSFPEVLP